MRSPNQINLDEVGCYYRCPQTQSRPTGSISLLNAPCCFLQLPCKQNPLFYKFFFLYTENNFTSTNCFNNTKVANEYGNVLFKICQECPVSEEQKKFCRFFQQLGYVSSWNGVNFVYAQNFYVFVQNCFLSSSGLKNKI